MKVNPEQAELIPQPKIPGNGCCCRCCGASPHDINVENIKKHGNANGRWIQKADGRIIEYFVYGSEEPDAKIFLQIGGDMSSAKLFPELPSIVKVLKDRNVKAISVNIAGFGFTSANPLRRIGEWAKSDVDPVLEAEGISADTPLMIEGSSFGSIHCYSLLHYYQDRVTAAHFHVPPLPRDLAKELNVSASMMGCNCTAKHSTSCFLIPGNCCSPCLHCCCTMCLPMAADGMKEVQKLPNYDSIKAEHGFETWEIVRDHSVKHCFANGFHGQIYSVYLKQMYEQWGFHPFNDIKLANVQRMKIMISYGEKDPTSPESHGEYMANFYSEKCNRDGKMFKNVEPREVVGNEFGGKCLVNYAPGGHEAHFIPFFKGELVGKFIDLCTVVEAASSVAPPTETE
jgi:pimeloyl-ACP methyl ester carboxylesterase